MHSFAHRPQFPPCIWRENLCGKPNSALIALLRPLHPLHYTPKHNNERHTRLQDHSESSQDCISDEGESRPSGACDTCPLAEAGCCCGDYCITRERAEVCFSRWPAVCKWFDPCWPSLEQSLERPCCAQRNHGRSRMSLCSWMGLSRTSHRTSRDDWLG